MKKKSFLLLLFFSIGLYISNAQTKIISQGEEWLYYDIETPPIKGWEKQTNLTDDWKRGPSPLGYGSFELSTVINFDKEGDKKNITKYFKKTFRIKDPFEYLAYKLNIQMDDGIVIYLNGNEIIRKNMPDGEITHSTIASSQIVSKKIETSIHTNLLLPENLNYGINTISASVHQGSSNSVDCIFNLELIGEKNTEIIPLLLKERTLENLTLNSKIKDLNNKFETEKKQLQIDAIQQIKNNYKYGFYTILSLFIIALISLFYAFNYNRKKNNRLSQNISDLKNINANKDQELMSYSLNSIQNQQFLKETKNTLDETVKEDSATLKKEVKKVIRKIDYNIEHDDDWLKLLNHFNALHQGYIDKLIKKHPSLSETELRHCVFIKLYMQTKEIAQILHIDPRSVQAARYRIKKKMNLGETIDLRNYLQDI